MTRRAGWCALLLVLFVAVPLCAAKRRAVTTGEGRCVFATLDDDAYVAAVAIDATDAYYVDDFDLTLYRVPKDGGPRLALTTFRSVLVTDIEIDEIDVFVATIPATFTDIPLPGTIYGVSKNGGGRRTVAADVVLPVNLGVDATHVYWISGGTYNFATETISSDGKVERILKNGTGRQTLAQGLSAPFTLALDGNDVYFSETGFGAGNTSHGVRRVAKSGGSVTHVQDTHFADVITQTDTDIVFFGGTADFSEAGIFRVPKNGGAPVLIAGNGENIFGGPVVAGGFVYFVRFDEEAFVDQLMRAPLTGGSEQLVHEDLWNQYDFAVDECGVYFGNASGEFLKVPR